MASTGEVGCIGENYYEAILKKYAFCRPSYPEENILISSGPTRSKVELLNSTRMLIEKGIIFTARQERLNSLKRMELILKSFTGRMKIREPNIMEYLHDRKDRSGYQYPEKSHEAGTG